MTTNAMPRPEGIPFAIHKCLYTLFYNLARILIKTLKISFRQIEPLMKQAFVDAAAAEGTTQDGLPTKQLVAMLSGIAPRDLKQYYGRRFLDQRAEPIPQVLVMDTWSRSKRWRNETGSPMKLPFESEVGRSFSELVKSCRLNYTPKTVLNDLIGSGIVGTSDDGEIELIRADFVSPVLEDRLIDTMRSLVNHTNTIRHNLLSPESGSFYQQSVRSRFIPRHRLSALNNELHAKLRAIDKDFFSTITTYESEADDVEKDTVGIELVYWQTLIEEKLGGVV